MAQSWTSSDWAFCEAEKTLHNAAVILGQYKLKKLGRLAWGGLFGKGESKGKVRISFLPLVSIKHGYRLSFSIWREDNKNCEQYMYVLIKDAFVAVCSA